VLWSVFYFTCKHECRMPVLCLIFVACALVLLNFSRLCDQYLWKNCNKLSNGNVLYCWQFTWVLLCAFLLDCTAIALQLEVLSQVMFCSKKSSDFFDFRRFLNNNSPVKTARLKSHKGYYFPSHPLSNSPVSPYFGPECMMSTDWPFCTALRACWNRSRQCASHLRQAAVTLLMSTHFWSVRSRSF